MFDLIDIALAALKVCIDILCVGTVGLGVTALTCGAIELVMCIAHAILGDRR